MRLCRAPAGHLVQASPLARRRGHPRVAPSLGRAAKHGATVILSGLLRRQAARIITVYAGQGMVLRKKLERGDWATLMLEKR